MNSNSLVSFTSDSVAVFRPGMAFRDWLSEMIRLSKEGKRTQWTIATGINFGYREYVQNATSDKPLYKVKYRDALTLLKGCYELQSLRDLAWVEANVDPSLRNDKLTFTHHRAVASLPQSKQKKYLTIAANDGLSVADLNELIRSNEAEVKSSNEPSEIKPGPLEWATRLSLWAKQQAPDVERWALERVKVVEADIRAVAELHRKLQERLATVEQRGRGVRLAP